MDEVVQIMKTPRHVSLFLNGDIKCIESILSLVNIQSNLICLAQNHMQNASTGSVQ